VEIEGLTDSIHYNLVQFSIFDDENFEYQAQDGLQQRSWPSVTGPRGARCAAG